MKHIDIGELYGKKEDYLGRKITVCGWVRTSRDSKQICFVELFDGTAMKNLQLIIDKEKVAECGKFSVGAAICATGTLIPCSNREQPFELSVESTVILGDSPADYPLQKKRHSLEYLRTIPHLRLRTNTFAAMMRIRSALALAIHDFFRSQGFLYVHTPIITGSDCEGAGEIFRVTSQPFDSGFDNEEEYYKNDFFGQKAGLTVSGQLEGEAFATAFGKIYTFGPTFRAENSNTARHAAEFWQIEPEVAFAELDDIIELAQNMIKSITAALLENCTDELAFFDKFFENGLIKKLQFIVDSDFEICEYTRAVELLEKSGKQFDYPVSWGTDLQTEHERYLTEEIFKKPVFVTNYPKDIKSFYMKLNPDGKTVAATDLLVPGVGEIIGASSREDNYEALKAQILSRNMRLEDYEWYLDLRKFGSVPHSGFGLGFERMLMYVTGIGNIRDTTGFPRTKNNLA